MADTPINLSPTILAALCGNPLTETNFLQPFGQDLANLASGDAIETDAITDEHLVDFDYTTNPPDNVLCSTLKWNSATGKFEPAVDHTHVTHPGTDVSQLTVTVVRTSFLGVAHNVEDIAAVLSLPTVPYKSKIIFTPTIRTNIRGLNTVTPTSASLGLLVRYTSTLAGARADNSNVGNYGQGSFDIAANEGTHVDSFGEWSLEFAANAPREWIVVGRPGYAPIASTPTAGLLRLDVAEAIVREMQLF